LQEVIWVLVLGAFGLFVVGAVVLGTLWSKHASKPVKKRLKKRIDPDRTSE
jgi:hypothetical protein